MHCRLARKKAEAETDACNQRFRTLFAAFSVSSAHKPRDPDGTVRNTLKSLDTVESGRQRAAVMSAAILRLVVSAPDCDGGAPGVPAGASLPPPPLVVVCSALVSSLPFLARPVAALLRLVFPKRPRKGAVSACCGLARGSNPRFMSTPIGDATRLSASNPSACCFVFSAGLGDTGRERVVSGHARAIRACRVVERARGGVDDSAALTAAHEVFPLFRVSFRGAFVSPRPTLVFVVVYGVFLWFVRSLAPLFLSAPLKIAEAKVDH